MMSEMDPTGDLSDFEPGERLEVTYDGVRGSRTITVYVVRAYNPYNDSEVIDETLRVKAADPDARRARFIRFDIEGGPTVVKSLNSKSSRGQRLGLLEDIQRTGEVSDVHASVGELLESNAGDILLVDGEPRVVTHRGASSVTVEPIGGGEETKYYARPYGVTEQHDYNGEPVRIERTGQRTRNGDAATVFAAIEGYGHGHDDGAVETVVINGTRYDVVYRHNAEDEGIRMASSNVDAARRNFDSRLRLDPIGLKLQTGFFGTADGVAEQRLSVDEIALIRAADCELTEGS